jgi:hypothetical protein
MFFKPLCTFLLFLVSISTADAGAEECTLYLAPSKRPQLGRGIISGINLTTGTLIDHSFGLVFPRSVITDNFMWQMLNYDWDFDKRENPIQSDWSMIALGIGSFFNHKNPHTASHTLLPLHLKEGESFQTEAHTTVPSIPYTMLKDVEFGEEIFVSYGEGNDWLELRDIVDVTSNATSNATADVSENPSNVADETNETKSYLYTPEELKEHGHCLTHVKVWDITHHNVVDGVNLFLWTIVCFYDNSCFVKKGGLCFLTYHDNLSLLSFVLQIS